MDPFLNSEITIASGRTCDFLPHQQKYSAISLNFSLQRSEIKKAIQIGSLSRLEGRYFEPFLAGFAKNKVFRLN